MCIKKILEWFKPEPEPIPEPEPEGPRRIALLFGINNYPGSANDLQGCLNDIDDVETKLETEFPDFVIRKFKDSQVTNKNLFNTIKDTLIALTEGSHLYVHYSGHGTQIPSASEPNGYNEALYLYDGPFLDDQLQELMALTPEGVNVTCKFDSCFSGDMLRNPIRNRFYAMPGLKVRHKSVKRISKTDTKNWIVISGCGEEQTSADAYIAGRYNGAFTYYDNKSYGAATTYKDEMTRLHVYLPNQYYDQNPTIDGNPDLFNNLVFSNINLNNQK